MNPDEILKAIISPENLQWAWQKVSKCFNAEAAWKDEIEISAFELNLKHELQLIAENISLNKYKLTPLKPIPQPKKRDKTTHKLQLRQLFWISIRDQVAWVAIINIIGPKIDSAMPLWSYGNRLHRSAWYDESVDGKNILRIGPYRHSSGLIYRKFSQSWPLYRRYIYLTLRRMAMIGNVNVTFELEDTDQKLLETESNSPPEKRMPYFQQDYWEESNGEVYWAAIDFKTFYPNLDLRLVRRIICRELLISEEHSLDELLKTMMEFPVDYSDFNDEQLSDIGLNRELNPMATLPTGLIAAGFLANVAMLEIDRKVAKETKTYQVAHYRYVDDHVILASSFENLKKWLKRYKELIDSSGIATISLEKTVPEELIQCFSESDIATETYQKIRAACLVDPVYPKPLMTKTLSRVSQLARLDFEFLNESEQEATLNDLELLLLADIGDSELPETTRVSFAATLITRFSALLTYPNEDIYKLSELNRAIIESKDKVEVLIKELEFSDSPNSKERLSTEILSIRTDRITPLELDYKNTKDELQKKSSGQSERSYALLIKAIHENPEKLRLWQRALDFCLATGFKGLSKLQDELKRTKLEAPVAGLYIESILYSALSKNLVCAISKIQYEELSDSRKIEIFDFIYDSLETISNWQLEDQRPYYYQNSYQLLSSTADVVVQLLLFLNLSSERTSLERAQLELRKLKNSVSIFYDRYEKQLDPKKYKPILVWWVETVSAPKNTDKPTDIWADQADSLNIEDENSWMVWQKYPTKIPKIAIEAILSGNKKFDKGHSGWLIDAMYDRLLNNFSENPNLPDEVNHVLKNLNSEDSISIFEWAIWANELDSNANFDPRTGEWTSLEIIRQILEKILNPDELIFKDLPIHPANIYLPIEWKILDSECFVSKLGVPTWESWKKIARERKPISISKSEYQIEDYRFQPKSLGNYEYDQNWLKVRSIALILLGLLRKSFSWPGSWNIPDHAPFLHRSTRNLIGDLSCSSITTAILEACLLPRSRETVLIDKLQSDIHSDSDTTYDAPPITDLYDFLTNVKKSQEILEAYQFTVQAYKPIQLVPLQIEQLNRYSISLEFEGDAVNE